LVALRVLWYNERYNENLNNIVKMISNRQPGG